MTYYIFTLGCQMNKSDSERIAAVLKSCGFKPVREAEADLIVVNACSVRQSAVDRIYGKLRVWQGKKILITGCVLPHDKEKLSKKVDLIFNIEDLSKLPRFLSKILGKNFQAFKYGNNYFKIPPLIPNRYSLIAGDKREAFVPIMTGCDNFCSYCAVPYTRGREISRPEKEIICEVENLVKKGYKKITLLGQNVNTYRPDFVKLLKRVLENPGDFKLKFLTSNPWDFSDALIEVLKEPKISKEIHLPIQSGDDAILKKMNRPYTAKDYLKLVNKLRTQISNLLLSTDLIVGFPGETKEAFENTVYLCKTVKFNKAYIAMYSKRPGTAAYKFKDDVPKQEKKRRWEILDKLINKGAHRKKTTSPGGCPKALPS